MINYQPISKLSILSKVLERLLNDQLKDFFQANNILSPYQSGFRKQQSTITASIKVRNDLIESLDNRKSCAALFVDLSKAFDTVEHFVLVKTTDQKWFANHLSDRMQCLHHNGCSSSVLNVASGVPQGSVLAPLLFSIYVNTLGRNSPDAKLHFLR